MTSAIWSTFELELEVLEVVVVEPEESLLEPPYEYEAALALYEERATQLFGH